MSDAALELWEIIIPLPLGDTHTTTFPRVYLVDVMAQLLSSFTDDEVKRVSLYLGARLGVALGDEVSETWLRLLTAIRAAGDATTAGPTDRTAFTMAPAPAAVAAAAAAAGAGYPAGQPGLEAPPLPVRGRPGHTSTEVHS